MPILPPPWPAPPPPISTASPASLSSSLPQLKRFGCTTGGVRTPRPSVFRSNSPSTILMSLSCPVSRVRRSSRKQCAERMACEHKQETGTHKHILYMCITNPQLDKGGPPMSSVLNWLPPPHTHLPSQCPIFSRNPSHVSVPLSPVPFHMSNHWKRAPRWPGGPW